MKDSPVPTVMLPPEPRVKQSLDVVLYLSPDKPEDPEDPEDPEVPDVPLVPDVPEEPLVP